MSGLQRTAPAAPHPHSPRYLLHVCWPAIWRARGCQATIVFEISQNRVNRLKTIFHIFPYLSISDGTNRHTHTHSGDIIYFVERSPISPEEENRVLKAAIRSKCLGQQISCEKRRTHQGTMKTSMQKSWNIHDIVQDQAQEGSFMHQIMAENGGKWWKQNPIWCRVMQSGLSASEADTPFLPMTSRCVRISAKKAGLTGVIKHAGVYNKESEAHLTKYLRVYYSYNWLIGDTSSQNPYIFGDGEAWRPIMLPSHLSSEVWAAR